MANQFGFVSEETFAEKMDVQNQFLAGLLAIQGGSVKPTSWKDVQTLVRSGLAPTVFHVGDQLSCQCNGTTLVWDIIGFDHDKPVDSTAKHSMTLQLHDCLPGIQFSHDQAFWYCETALNPGTYYITWGTSWGNNVVKDKHYQFTLTKPVPVGGQLLGFYGAPDTAASGWKVSSYESNSSNTAIETVAVTEGTSGTSLGTITVAVQGNLNSLHRLAYGSNNWKESAIRQYLNSDKAAGSVWKPQTKFDRPPAWVSDTAGFMNGWDADFLSVIGEVEKVTCRNTVTDGGGSDTTKDKFFLLSRSELYMGREQSSVDEGEPYPYYADFSDLSTAGTSADTNRIKYRSGSAQYWWQRTPYSGNGNNVRYVHTSGALSYGSAVNRYGVAPACNII